MASKSSLIAQGLWDFYNDRPLSRFTNKTLKGNTMHIEHGNDDPTRSAHPEDDQPSAAPRKIWTNAYGKNYAMTKCTLCGIQPLTEDEYQFQLANPDSLWACPVCHSACTWYGGALEDGSDLPETVGHTFLQPSTSLTKLEYAAIHILAGMYVGNHPEDQALPAWAAKAAAGLFGEVQKLQMQAKDLDDDIPF